MKKNLTWEVQCSMLKELETILKKYGFKFSLKPKEGKKQYIIDAPDRISCISGLNAGWRCDYPELEKYIDTLSSLKIIWNEPECWK